ncbi:MAG: DinB family protein, partial [Gammaproteobacteria bacterium]
MSRTSMAGEQSIAREAPSAHGPDGCVVAAAHSLQERHCLSSELAQCRENTETICRPLEIEDHVVQPAPFVSPPKWHLAHTTWFFDCFLLANRFADEARQPAALFNSYYKSLGEHWLQ